MAVLVTGGAGYIGSHMVLALLDRGIGTVVIDNLSTGHRSLVPDEAEFIEGDIGNPDLLEQVFGSMGIDAVIHFAGSIVVPDSITDPIGYYWNNTIKSHTLVSACVNAGIRKFVFSSTAAVYGVPEANKVSESATLLPITPYGTSKLMTEWMLRDTAAAHDFNYMALRYFNVAGADPLLRSGQLSKTATHLLKVALQVATGNRDKLAVFGKTYDTRDGSCIRDYVHVSDLVSAHLLALEHLSKGGQSGVVNCGNEHGTTVLEMINAVERVLETKLNTVIAPPRKGDPVCLIADTSKARELLGWQPELSVDDMIRTAFEWEKKIN